MTLLLNRPVTPLTPKTDLWDGSLCYSQETPYPNYRDSFTPRVNTSYLPFIPIFNDNSILDQPLHHDSLSDSTNS